MSNSRIRLPQSMIENVLSRPCCRTGWPARTWWGGRGASCPTSASSPSSWTSTPSSSTRSSPASGSTSSYTGNSKGMEREGHVGMLRKLELFFRSGGNFTILPRWFIGNHFEIAKLSKMGSQLKQVGNFKCTTTVKKKKVFLARYRRCCQMFSCWQHCDLVVTAKCCNCVVTQCRTIDIVWERSALRLVCVGGFSQWSWCWI